MSQSNDIRWISPVTGPVDAVVPVPGSKSITNRLLLLAALAHGPSRISGVLRSDDTDDFANGLSALGFRLEQTHEDKEYLIHGSDGRVPVRSAKVWCGSAGTAARFLPAVAAAGHGEYRFDASPQMRKRPMDPLLKSLESQGAGITKPAGGAFPLSISAAGLKGGKLTLGGATVSSQYLSAPAHGSPLGEGAGGNYNIPCQSAAPTLTSPASSCPDSGSTCCSRATRGSKSPRQASTQGEIIRLKATLRRLPTSLPPPPSPAAPLRYPTCQGATSLQGDIRFLDILERMGCHVASDEESVTVTGPTQLRGVTVDMSDISDTVMTLACIAPYGDSTTTIQNIGHIPSPGVRQD